MNAAQMNFDPESGDEVLAMLDTRELTSHS